MAKRRIKTTNEIRDQRKRIEEGYRAERERLNRKTAERDAHGNIVSLNGSITPAERKRLDTINNRIWRSRVKADEYNRNIVGSDAGKQLMREIKNRGEKPTNANAGNVRFSGYQDKNTVRREADNISVKAKAAGGLG